MILKKNTPVFVTTDDRRFLELPDARRHQIGLDLEKIFASSAEGFGLDKDQLTEFVCANYEQFQQMFSQLQVTQ